MQSVPENRVPCFHVCIYSISYSEILLSVLAEYI